MALTAGNEIGLFLQADHALSYGQIETALVDAGFTDYIIVRSVNADSTDLQLTVRSYEETFDAVDTLSRLSNATSALNEQSPA